MPISSVPYLSPNQIELKAEEVITYFTPGVMEKYQATPIMEIMKRMKEEFNVLYDYDTDLGYTRRGTKIIGLFYKSPKAIFVDRTLKGQPNFPFILGHEIGHFVLHRRLRIHPSEYDFTPDTVRELVTGRRVIRMAKERIEWQANKFSSSFLMPRRTIREAVMHCQRTIGTVKNIGTVFVDLSHSSGADFSQLLSALQQIYGVSRTALEHRLADQCLLVDHRAKTTMHISQLLSEE